MDLIVTQKGSILSPGGILLIPGTRITSGSILTAGMIREQIRSGFLAEVPSGAPAPAVAPEETPMLREDNVGDSKGTGMTTPTQVEDASTQAHAKTQIAGIAMPNTEGGISQGKIEKPEGGKLISPGKWNQNPQILYGMSLEHLNLMVLNIDKDVVPFDTIEEARAQLSMDWKEEE